MECAQSDRTGVECARIVGLDFLVRPGTWVIPPGLDRPSLKLLLLGFLFRLYTPGLVHAFLASQDQLRMRRTECRVVIVCLLRVQF